VGDRRFVVSCSSLSRFRVALAPSSPPLELIQGSNHFARRPLGSVQHFQILQPRPPNPTSNPDLPLASNLHASQVLQSRTFPIPSRPALFHFYPLLPLRPLPHARRANASPTSDSKRWSLLRCTLTLFLLLLLLGSLETSLILCLRPALDRSLQWPLNLMAALSALLLALGVGRHYVDIWQHRDVRGISFLFVGIDATGDLTSLLSLCASFFSSS
jgi:hypothetical protein